MKWTGQTRRFGVVLLIFLGLVGSQAAGAGSVAIPGQATNLPAIIITNIIQAAGSKSDDSGSSGTIEIVVAIVGVLGSVILLFVRKIVENRSIRLAIDAEIKRLYEVIGWHLQWREEMKAEGDPAFQTTEEVQPGPKVAPRPEPSTDSDKKEDAKVKWPVPEPLIPFTHPVYLAQVKNIGVLHKDKVRDVVTFYGLVEFLNKLQKRQEDYRDMGKLNAFNWKYNGLLQRVMDKYRVPFGEGYEPRPARKKPLNKPMDKQVP